MTNADAQRLLEVAVRHAQAIQVCIDRLRELGANAELRLLTGLLQRLSFRATPPEPEEGQS